MEPLLRLQDVSVRFAGLKALAGVTFDAHGGEVRAVIGPNGAGKTTLFNVISGYVPASDGAIHFKGEPIHGLAPHHISVKGVRRTFQNGGLFPELTVLENVLAASTSRSRAASWESSSVRAQPGRRSARAWLGRAGSSI